MEPETPPVEEKKFGDVTGQADDDVAKKLAEEVSKAHGNGNGNGHTNGHGNGSTNGQADADKGKRKFSLFSDLENETQQDEAEEKKEKTGAGQQQQEKKNPFSEYDPSKDDVKQEELNDQERITLEEANARVSLYLAALDFTISQACCIVRGDFSINSQTRYRMHPWRRKAIQIPWVRLVMLPKKRSNPAWSLWGAILAGTIPIIGMAAVDRMHDNKVKNDPDYAARTKGEARSTEQQQAKQEYRYDNTRGKKYGPPRDPYGPNVDEGEFVEYEEVRDEDLNQEPPKSRVGRHSKTCPKHLDADSKEPCNCKPPEKK